MSENFVVEIISPDKSILKANANEVTIPSYEGQMGILKDHIPLITFLRPGIISIKSQEEKNFFVEEGTVEFSNNNLLILTSKCKNLNNLDAKNIEEIIEDSQKKINQSELSDKERYLLSHKIDSLREINK
jgi:ATP synthase F1 epsilon subunit